MDKKRTNRAWILLAVVFAVVMVGLYVYIYLIPDIADSMTQTCIVEYGKVQNVDELRCVVVREETLYTAKSAGSVSRYVSEASKTCKGVKVADIYGASGKKTSLTCRITGFVSFYTDGLESYFTPDSIMTLEPEEYMDMDVVPSLLDAAVVSEGDPVFKLIESNTWYLVLIVPRDRIEQYAVGNAVTIQVDEAFTVKSKVSAVCGTGDHLAVIVPTKHYYDKLCSYRMINVRATTGEQEGLIVPSTAVVETQSSDGPVYGLYVLGVDGEYTFKTATVLAAGADETLIKNDEKIKLYDEVLRNAAEY